MTICGILDEILSIFNKDEILERRLNGRSDLHIYIELVHRPYDTDQLNFDYNKLLPYIQNAEIRYWDVLSSLKNCGFNNIFFEGPTPSERAIKFDASNLEIYKEVRETVSMIHNSDLSAEVQEEMLAEIRIKHGAFPFYFVVQNRGCTIWGVEDHNLRKERAKLALQKDEIVMRFDQYFGKNIEITPVLEGYRKKAIMELKDLNYQTSLIDIERGIAAANNLVQTVNKELIDRSILFFGSGHSSEIEEIYSNSKLQYAVIRLNEVKEALAKMRELVGRV